MARNTFLSWDTTDSNNTDVGGNNIAEGCPPSSINNAIRNMMAQLRIGVDGNVIYASKSGNYTALATDNNAVHRYTATATVALTAAATLAANWHYTVMADGADVTIDPNGAETINGQATLVVKNGTSATIICDGTAFYTVIRPMAWEFISYSIVSGTPTTIDFTNLGSFKTLRLTGWLSGSGVTGSLLARTSTNNGSSYDSGAADYATQIASVTNATVGNASVAGATFMQLSSGNGVSNISFQIIITRFNQASITQFLSNVYGTDNSAAVFVATGGGQRASTTARNAFRLLVAAGTFSGGELTLEGIR